MLQQAVSGIRKMWGLNSNRGGGNAVHDGRVHVDVGCGRKSAVGIWKRRDGKNKVARVCVGSKHGRDVAYR